MTPSDELRAKLATLAFVESKSNQPSSDEGVFSNHGEADPDEVAALQDYLEQCEVAEAQGAFYADALTARDYVAELGDPRSAIDDLYATHGSVAIDKEMLADHPVTQIAQELSDQMNSSRITTHRDPIVRQPRNFI